MIYPFVVALLITIALGIRSLYSGYNWDAVSIWWINFLPVCAMLYLGSHSIWLKSAQIAAFCFYLIFHLYYIGFHGWFADIKSWLDIFRSDFVFWPISILSFIIVTYLTILGLKNK